MKNQKAMMGSLVKLVLCFSVLFILSEAKTEVKIQNDIPRENITIHCYSVDDDVGTHLLTYGQSFSIRFWPNFFGGTKFYCGVKSLHGAGIYLVFDDFIASECYDFCLWFIRANGLCLRRNDNSLSCERWTLYQPST